MTPAPDVLPRCARDPPAGSARPWQRLEGGQTEVQTSLPPHIADTSRRRAKKPQSRARASLYLLAALFLQLRLRRTELPPRPSSLRLHGDSTPGRGDRPLHGTSTAPPRTSRGFPVRGPQLVAVLAGCSFGTHAIAMAGCRCVAPKSAGGPSCGTGTRQRVEAFTCVGDKARWFFACLQLSARCTATPLAAAANTAMGRSALCWGPRFGPRVSPAQRDPV